MKDGGPAFPHWDDVTKICEWSGMSLRDYFAAAALIGLVMHEGTKIDSARVAYGLSTAMLVEREAHR